MDAFDLVRSAINDTRSQCSFVSGHRIIEDANFDRAGFEEQSSDVPGFETEFINQSGPGITGDDYHGTMAFRLPDDWWLLIDYTA